MTEPGSKRFMSVEGVIGVLSAIIPVVVDMNWLLRSLFVLVAMGLTGHLAWRSAWHRAIKFIAGLIGIGLLFALTWHPIWEDFHKAYPMAKLEPSQLVTTGVVGVTVFALIALSGTVWQHFRREPATAADPTASSSRLIIAEPPVKATLGGLDVVSPSREKPKYTGAMLEKRMAEYEQLFNVLHTSSNGAFEDGWRILNEWPSDVINHGPAAYADRLSQYTKRAGDSFIELKNVIDRYEYFPDIRTWMLDRFRIQGEIYEPAGLFAQATRALPEHPAEQTVRLTESQWKTFQAGLAKYRKWIDETKEQLAARIQDESVQTRD